jgi:uncharacterized protein YdeI (YjbR/CyaY-like superfamily)
MKPIEAQVGGEENPKANFYFEKSGVWRAELDTLRRLILETELCEEVKWGVPTYTFEGRNVVLIHVFKAYCALLFHKGALLSDPEGILVQQTENVQAARQIRFTSLEHLKGQLSVVKTYITAAIDIEKAGLKVAMKPTANFIMVEEFSQYLEQVAGLRAAFEALTPGRQRGYLLHFAGAKLAKTRMGRVEAAIPRILAGKGLED